MVLVPLDLTYVQYSKHDNLGKLCALLSQTPPFLLVSIATLCLRGRELGTFTFLLGLLIAAGVSSKLKHFFHEPRPAGFGLDHQPGGVRLPIQQIAVTFTPGEKMKTAPTDRPRVPVGAGNKAGFGPDKWFRIYRFYRSSVQL
jgi:hypothetical protein